MQVSPFMCQHGHWCFCTAPNDSGQSSVLYLTSISETIQKAPLAEAKTALGKQKIRLYVECRYLSHYRNSVKNCFLTQNFTDIWQSAAELWPKKIFNTANLHLCNNFRQNPLIFCWDNVILRFAIRRFCNTAAILTFQNLEFMPHDLYRHNSLLPSAKFHKGVQSSAESWPKTIFKMAANRHHEFWKFFIFGHLAVIDFQMCSRVHQNRMIFAAQCYASAAYVVMWCLSVCSSVTLLGCVKTNIHHQNFFHHRVATPF